MANKAVAVYIRLSVEDSKTDSLSIEGQRKIINHHLKSLPEYAYSEILEFVDNGYSGTTFERPAMNELIELVNQNKIACIIVKDFSRFGRNMLRTGYFLEKVFPLFGTRFIAVTDTYDSNNYQYSSGGLDVTFKYLISEYYSKDLSVKSKQARHAKMKRGEYVSTNTSYGYKLSKERKMIIDEDVADNVRMIFRLALEGKSATEIKTVLYQNKIPTPAEYKALKGKKHYDISRSHNIWSSSTILRLLYDERYTGTYIMGKSEVKKVGGSHMRKRDENKWYKIPNAHPAIIDKADFDRLQEILIRFKCPREKQKEYPLMGKVYCGCCEHSMQRISKKVPTFHCRFTDAIESFPCYNLTITVQELCDIIYDILLKQAEIIFAMKETTDISHLQFDLKRQDSYSIQIDDMKKQKVRLYENLMLKEISLDEYKKKKAIIDAKLTDITNTFNTIAQNNKNTLSTKEEKEKRLLLAEKITAQKSLTKELVDLLIEKVNVYPNNQIEILWKSKDFIA